MFNLDLWATPCSISHASHAQLNRARQRHGAKERREPIEQGGGQMDRLSSRTSPVEALAIVCLVSVVLVTTALVVRFGCSGVVELFSGPQLTAFVR